MQLINSISISESDQMNWINKFVNILLEDHFVKVIMTTMWRKVADELTVDVLVVFLVSAAAC